MGNRDGADILRMADTDGTIARHLDHLRSRNLRPSTIYQRRRTLVRLVNSADPCGLLDLDGATIDSILMAKGTQPETRATDISHIRGFYRWAVLDGLLDVDPSVRLVRPKLARRLPRPISDADLRLALDAAPSETRLILLLACFAGLRACEIAQARGEHVRLDSAPPLLIVMESKGGGMSSVPIHPELGQALATAPRKGPLIPRGDGLAGQLNPWSISQRANVYLRSEGIDATLHQLRHWYGTNLYQSSGRDLRVTQEGMRHRTPVSTAIYTWIDPGAITDAVTGLTMPA